MRFADVAIVEKKIYADSAAAKVRFFPAGLRSFIAIGRALRTRHFPPLLRRLY